MRTSHIGAPYCFHEEKAVAGLFHDRRKEHPSFQHRWSLAVSHPETTAWPQGSVDTRLSEYVGNNDESARGRRLRAHRIGDMRKAFTNAAWK